MDGWYNLLQVRDGSKQFYLHVFVIAYCPTVRVGGGDGSAGAGAILIHATECHHVPTPYEPYSCVSSTQPKYILQNATVAHE